MTNLNLQNTGVIEDNAGFTQAAVDEMSLKVQKLGREVERVTDQAEQIKYEAENREKEFKQMVEINRE